MKAMLLAAGFGERMRPLTGAVPKPVLPVLGRPMAVQILERLVAAGVRHAVINLHHLPRRVRSVLGDGRDAGLDTLRYSHEEAILGTGGGIRQAADGLRGEGPFLVHNADCLSDVDVGALASAHAASGRLATLVLAPAREPYTVVETAADGRVAAIGGRPAGGGGPGAGRHLFTGIHVLDEALLDRLPEGPSDVVRDLYLGLVAEGRVGSFVHPGFWWEFGSPWSYLEGTLRLLDLDPEARERVARTDPVREVDGARVAVGVGADFHAGVSLVGRAALGMASQIGEGSEIEDSVVMPEAWVGPGCRLRRTIVAPGTELPAGFEADGALVCADPGGDPPPGASRRGGLLVSPLRPGAAS